MKKEHSVIKTMLILLTLAIVGYLIRLAFNAYLARNLPPALYGDFAVAVRVLAIITSMILLGTNTSAKRFLPLYLSTNDPHMIHNYLSWNFRVIITTTLVCLLVIAGALGILFYLHFKNILLLQELHLVVHLLWLSPLSAMVLLFSSFLLCNKNYYLASFFKGSAKFVFMFLFLIVGLYFLEITLASQHLIGMVLLALLFILVIEFIAFQLCLPDDLLTSLKAAWQKPKAHKQEWTTASIRLVSNEIIFLVLSAADLIMVELISPREADVAYYAVTLTIAGIIWIIPNSIYNILKPKISPAISNKDFSALQKKINQTNYITYGTTIPITILLNIFSHKIFLLFGSQFVQKAETTLLILSIGYIVGALNKPAILLLAYSGREKNLLNLTLIEFIVLVILGCILTYFYGIVGTAISASLAIIIKAVLAYRLVRKHYPLHPCLF